MVTIKILANDASTGLVETFYVSIDDEVYANMDDDALEVYLTAYAQGQIFPRYGFQYEVSE